MFTENITLSTNWIEEISTIADLKKINDFPQGYYVLKNNIDLNNEEWQPIDTFTGTFDGNGYSIKNLSITNSHTYVGLFGESLGIIKNVNLENVHINISNINSNIYVGALCGINGGTVEQVETDGNINVENHSSPFNSYVSGIVGADVISSSQIMSITNATNNCTVTGPKYVGGILGVSNFATLSNLTNSGNIKSNNTAGGIVGYTGNTIQLTNCLNFGNITSDSYCGGLVGATDITNYDSGIIFLKCGNEGAVCSTSDQINIGSGGLIGTTFNCICLNVYNNANIQGNDAGGLIGVCYYSSQIQRAYSNGVINGKNSAGGFFAYSGLTNCCTISDSVVFGQITSTRSNNISGSNFALPVILNNVYYNCIADDYIGRQTNFKYEEDFYLSTLFWDEKDWNFCDNAYPSLSI